MTDPTPQPITRQTVTTEYVVGATGAFLRSGLRSLSWAFDDLTMEFGDDLYASMLHDPVVLACVNTLRASIIEEGMTLSTAVADEQADGYELAGEIDAFCSAVLSDLAMPLDDVLWDMLAAIALGSRVAELVWEDRPVRSWFVLDQSTAVSQNQTVLTLRAIKVKPRRATAFVVDPYLNVRGLVATHATTALQRSVTLADTRQLLPREKFFVVSFRPLDTDPRGTTVLRPAYNAWQLKRNIYPEFFKYLAQFASPSIYGVAGEGAQNVRVQQADGTILVRSPVELLQEALVQYQNGSALAVPYGTVIGVLKASDGGGEAFHNAFTHCDTQMTIGILHQTLATLEAQHQARASSEVHQDTVETIIRQAKRAICLAFRRDVLRPLVAYNYGPRAAALLTPSVSLGSVEQQDLASMMNAVANLARAAYLDMSQLPGVDAMLNLPPRTMVEPSQAGVTDEASTTDDEEPTDASL